MPFITLANPAGQPAEFIIQPSNNNETLQQVPGKTVCRWYWLLQSIRVDLHYTILDTSDPKAHEAITIQESRIMTPNQDAQHPRHRLCNPLDFSLNTSSSLSEAFYHLDLQYVYQSAQNERLFNIHFTINEYGYDRKICLSTDATSPDSNKNSHYTQVAQYTLDFESFPLTLYAYIKSDLLQTLSVQLHTFKLTPEFYRNCEPENNLELDANEASPSNEF